jgi:hypothetical protein
MHSDYSLSPIPPAQPRFPSWRLTYEAVLSETDLRTLFTRVEAAEAAIRTRRGDIQRNAVNQSEWRALEDALANLAVVKRERLNYVAGDTRR